MGFLMDDLSKKDKKGVLTQNVSLIGYPTKILPFDFRNGYQVKVYDKDDKVVDRWANIGLFSGTFITVAGKNGVAKTAFCVQAAAEICRPYKESEVFLLDLEGNSNISRLLTLTQYSMKEWDSKFHYLNDFHYVEEIFEFVYKVAETKCTNKDIFVYDTGKLNEFGEPMKQMVPTVIIIDSIPELVTKDLEGEMTMAGMTYAGRKARVIKEFYTRARPIMQRANIIIFAVNHINDKVDINPMAKTQADNMYLKQNEALPGGKAPLYLAQNLLKFVQCGKYTEEKDGFNGFMVRCEFIKSKTNESGTSCNLIYDMKTGFDRYKTLLEHIKANGLLEGRNPYCYFRSNPNKKFDSRKFTELCMEDPELYKEAMVCAGPSLYGELGNIDYLNKYGSESDDAVVQAALAAEPDEVEM